MTFFHWLLMSWWCNMSDIFYILSIPEIFYYYVIIVKSSLVTLVTSDVTHSTHSTGCQNWGWIGLFFLLSHLLYPFFQVLNDGIWLTFSFGYFNRFYIPHVRIKWITMGKISVANQVFQWISLPLTVLPFLNYSSSILQYIIMKKLTLSSSGN